LAKISLGLSGDFSFFLSRLIPIEQEPEKNDSNEPHYRATLVYSYPSELDDVQGEIKIDDSDPVSVVEHVKRMIRKLRPECELTDIMLELWNLALESIPDDQAKEKSPFKSYNPIQRRIMRDINPLSVEPWKSSRVTLLGDAAHAMSPVLGLGANNAIQDADNLSQALSLNPSGDYVSSIKEYENEMLKRSSSSVLASRKMTIRMHSPVGFFGTIIRNSMFKTLDIFMKIVSFFTTKVD
jgi:2-polyprenyl-6-methoxyphenol hydroxylase-like FAD-dependent oxidoreductase